jgi:diguanylate cyclase (GGDEF)-like protein/PAS domain S-box-containing protein
MSFNRNLWNKIFAKTDERLIEIILFFAVISVPFFVYFWIKLNPDAPKYIQWFSWAQVILLILFYCLTFTSSFVRRHLRAIFNGICYLLSVFLVYRTYSNGFSEGMSLVLMMVVFYIALTFEQIAYILSYVISISVLVGIGIYANRNYKNIYNNNGFVFIACLTFFSIIAVINLIIKNQNKKALNESKKDYQRLLDVSPDGIIVSSEEKIVYANDKVLSFTELKDKDFLVGKSFSEIIAPEDREQAAADIKEVLEGNDRGYIESKISFAEGKAIDVELVSMYTTYNGKDAVMTVARDISDRKRMQERINNMALHDPVTKLPNRYFLNLHLKKSFENFKITGKPVALMFIDFDRFKRINDTLGHNFGDALLNQVSKEIKKCLLENDFISRYGGDEFIIVLRDVTQERAEQTAQKIIESFTNPLSIGNHRVNITPSIGISFYPTHCKDAETLVKYADIAMYEAKAQGGNSYVLYKQEMTEKVSKKMMLENALREALEREEFIVYYQPQVDFATGNITGVEALIRWKHPEFGIIPPGDFIPIAEETGLIVQIGEWVLRTACMQSKAWQEAGLKPVTLAVNVSYPQLKHNGFINSVEEALRGSGLEPKYLELEITESILRDAEELKLVLAELAPLGVKLSIDDFGVGYSSLSMLQHVAINNIKIDMSFIRGIPESSKAAAIVKTIIDMGKNLNCSITAEGVEVREQVDFLRKNNCSLGQGYLFSRPIDGKDFEKLLRGWTSI